MCCFKPLSLGEYVKAATINWCNRQLVSSIFWLSWWPVLSWSVSGVACAPVTHSQGTGHSNGSGLTDPLDVYFWNHVNGGLGRNDFSEHVQSNFIEEKTVNVGQKNSIWLPWEHQDSSWEQMGSLLNTTVETSICPMTQETPELSYSEESPVDQRTWGEPSASGDLHWACASPSSLEFGKSSDI